MRRIESTYEVLKRFSLDPVSLRGGNVGEHDNGDDEYLAKFAHVEQLVASAFRHLASRSHESISEHLDVSRKIFHNLLTPDSSGQVPNESYAIVERLFHQAMCEGVLSIAQTLQIAIHLLLHCYSKQSLGILRSLITFAWPKITDICKAEAMAELCRALSKLEQVVLKMRLNVVATSTAPARPALPTSASSTSVTSSVHGSSSRKTNVKDLQPDLLDAVESLASFVVRLGMGEVDQGQAASSDSVNLASDERAEWARRSAEQAWLAVDQSRTLPPEYAKNSLPTSALFSFYHFARSHRIYWRALLGPVSLRLEPFIDAVLRHRAALIRLLEPRHLIDSPFGISLNVGYESSDFNSRRRAFPVPRQSIGNGSALAVARRLGQTLLHDLNKSNRTSLLIYRCEWSLYARSRDDLRAQATSTTVRRLLLKSCVRRVLQLCSRRPLPAVAAVSSNENVDHRHQNRRSGDASFSNRPQALEVDLGFPAQSGNERFSSMSEWQHLADTLVSLISEGLLDMARLIQSLYEKHQQSGGAGDNRLLWLINHCLGEDEARKVLIQHALEREDASLIESLFRFTVSREEQENLQRRKGCWAPIRLPSEGSSQSLSVDIQRLAVATEKSPLDGNLLLFKRKREERSLDDDPVADAQMEAGGVEIEATAHRPRRTSRLPSRISAAAGEAVGGSTGSIVGGGGTVASLVSQPPKIVFTESPLVNASSHSNSSSQQQGVVSSTESPSALSTSLVGLSGMLAMAPSCLVHSIQSALDSVVGDVKSRGEANNAPYRSVAAKMKTALLSFSARKLSAYRAPFSAAHDWVQRFSQIVQCSEPQDRALIADVFKSFYERDEDATTLCGVSMAWATFTARLLVRALNKPPLESAVWEPPLPLALVTCLSYRCRQKMFISLCAILGLDDDKEEAAVRNEEGAQQADVAAVQSSGQSHPPKRAKLEQSRSEAADASSGAPKSISGLGPGSADKRGVNASAAPSQRKALRSSSSTESRPLIDFQSFSHAPLISASSSLLETFVRLVYVTPALWLDLLSRILRSLRNSVAFSQIRALLQLLLHRFAPLAFHVGMCSRVLQTLVRLQARIARATSGAALAADSDSASAKKSKLISRPEVRAASLSLEEAVLHFSLPATCSHFKVSSADSNGVDGNGLSGLLSDQAVLRSLLLSQPDIVNVNNWLAWQKSVARVQRALRSGPELHVTPPFNVVNIEGARFTLSSFCSPDQELLDTYERNAVARSLLLPVLFVRFCRESNLAGASRILLSFSVQEGVLLTAQFIAFVLRQLVFSSTEQRRIDPVLLGDAVLFISRCCSDWHLMRWQNVLFSIASYLVLRDEEEEEEEEEAEEEEEVDDDDDDDDSSSKRVELGEENNNGEKLAESSRNANVKRKRRSVVAVAALWPALQSKDYVNSIKKAAIGSRKNTAENLKLDDSPESFRFVARELLRELSCSQSVENSKASGASAAPTLPSFVSLSTSTHTAPSRTTAHLGNNDRPWYISMRPNQCSVTDGLPPAALRDREFYPLRSGAVEPPFGLPLRTEVGLASAIWHVLWSLLDRSIVSAGEDQARSSLPSATSAPRQSQQAEMTEICSLFAEIMKSMRKYLRHSCLALTMTMLRTLQHYSSSPNFSIPSPPAVLSLLCAPSCLLECLHLIADLQTPEFFSQPFREWINSSVKGSIETSTGAMDSFGQKIDSFDILVHVKLHVLPAIADRVNTQRDEPSNSLPAGLHSRFVHPVSAWRPFSEFPGVEQALTVSAAIELMTLNVLLREACSASVSSQVLRGALEFLAVSPMKAEEPCNVADTRVNVDDASDAANLLTDNAGYSFDKVCDLRSLGAESAASAAIGLLYSALPNSFSADVVHHLVEEFLHLDQLVSQSSSSSSSWDQDALFAQLDEASSVASDTLFRSRWRVLLSVTHSIIQYGSIHFLQYLVKRLIALWPDAPAAQKQGQEPRLARGSVASNFLHCFAVRLIAPFLYRLVGDIELLLRFVQWIVLALSQWHSSTGVCWCPSHLEREQVELSLSMLQHSKSLLASEGHAILRKKVPQLREMAQRATQTTVYVALLHFVDGI